MVSNSHFSSLKRSDRYYVYHSLSIAEPWPSNVYNDPLFPLIPGLADKDNLKPLYEQVYAALRQHDPSHIVFYGKKISVRTVAQAYGIFYRF